MREDVGKRLDAAGFAVEADCLRVTEPGLRGGDVLRAVDALPLHKAQLVLGQNLIEVHHAVRRPTHQMAGEFLAAAVLDDLLGALQHSPDRLRPAINPVEWCRN